MKTHWIAVWNVAYREFRAILQTKGYWIFTFFYPLIFGGVLYILWGLLAQLPIDRWMENDEIEGSFGAAVLKELDAVNVYRNWFWGAPLPFYVVDQTGLFKQSIQREILVRDRAAYYSGLHLGSGTEQMPLGQFQKVLVDGDGAHDLTMIPGLSIHRFQEVQQPDISIERLNAWLSTGQLAGYFVLTSDCTTSNAGAQFVRPNSLSRAQLEKLNELKVWFEAIASSVRLAAIVDQTNLDQKVDDIQPKPIEIDIHHVVVAERTAGTLSSGTLVAEVPPSNWRKLFVIPFVWTFVTFMTLGINTVVTNTIEEKSSKVGELLVANASPAQILDGKLVGNLVTLLVRLLGFVVFVAPPLVGLIGILAGYESELFKTLLDPRLLCTWCLFFLLGFAFAGYVSGALGSLCTDAKEIMMALYPVHFIGTFGVLPAVIYTMIAPESALAQVFSFIPFFTASVMVARSSALPGWETYCLVVLALIVSILVMRKVMVPVFAHGMLSEHAPVRLVSVFLKRKIAI